MDRDGAQNIMAGEFGISLPSVYRIRKKLNLPHLHSPSHPGRRLLYKRIKKHYFEHMSTNKVARIVGMSAQMVNRILKSQNVELSPPYLTNPLLVSPHNGMTAEKFNTTIKKMYVDEGMTGFQIAEALNSDPATVTRRLRAMGVSLEQRHQFVEGGYPCLWCNKVMERVWIAHGSRKQRFCGSACKNKAKDYRRYKGAERRIAFLEEELRTCHSNGWELARDAIMKRMNKGNIKHWRGEAKDETKKQASQV